ncbi:COMM domain-containing protein 6-like [Varanus komodoensis]|nr:COMM domain-containing protein 6-like [Varanus komodoensis]
MAVSLDISKTLKLPYVTMTVKVADTSAYITSKTFEIIILQFQNFHNLFKEMASALETV